MKNFLLAVTAIAVMLSGCGFGKIPMIPDASEPMEIIKDDTYDIPSKVTVTRKHIEKEDTAGIAMDEVLSVEQILFASELESKLEQLTDEELQAELYFDSLELLAVCVMAEAGNQGLDGMRMVCDVILNRVDDSDFPNTIEGVITQRNQFSSYSDGRMQRWNVPSEECYQACQMELEKRSWPGLLYFRTGGYSQYGTPAFKYGNHYFSTK